jgi:hypothetical protein
MRKKFLAATMVFITLALTGCGDDHGSAPPTFVTDILSDPVFDGDIEQDLSGVLTITQGNTQSVFAGIDPATFSEFRAFLDFPLTGTNGVPGDAVIVSATLDIVINSISTEFAGGTIPIRIDLVSFLPPTLISTDFDRTIQPALATTTISPSISAADVGGHVAVDVTPLMAEAQRLGLPDFQVRILEELGPVSPGLIEINDTTGAGQESVAPLLSVTYQ